MVYLDYAATTPLNKRVKEAMIKAMDYYGNPSSNYTLANNSNQILEDCRKELTEYLNGSDGDFIFTSGGSEANTQAITKTFPDAILYNPTEHDSTILAIQSLEYSSRLNVKTLQIPWSFGRNRRRSEWRALRHGRTLRGGCMEAFKIRGGGRRGGHSAYPWRLYRRLRSFTASPPRHAWRGDDFHAAVILRAFAEGPGLR